MQQKILYEHLSWYVPYPAVIIKLCNPGKVDWIWVQIYRHTHTWVITRSSWSKIL